MRYGPDIARLAALIGDPARAAMLQALTSGAALTASELATEAGVTKQTASGHLAKLVEGGFLAVEPQGRHRYFRLADDQVAELLENLMGLAARKGPARVRTGPKEPEMRHARICYDHLAGELAVAMFDALVAQGRLRVKDGGISVTADGETFFADLGIDLPALRTLRRPVCRSCLDWSVRRTHLAGSLGAALLERVQAARWAKRVEGSRIVAFSRRGEQEFRAAFGL